MAPDAGDRSGPAPAGGQPQRVVMYVRNEVTYDARVLREAATLAATGRRVTVVGRLAERDGVAREMIAGVTILRVREDTTWRAGWRRSLVEIRSPWLSFRRIVRGLLGRDPAPGARIRAARDTILAVVCLPWIGYRALDHAVGGRFPAPAPGGDLDGLVRWRGDASRWAAAAVSVAPEADVHHGHDLTGLLAARDAARRDRVPFVYDSHDLVSDATSMSARSAIVRAWVRRLERGAARGAAAVITVNDGLAAVLLGRLRPRSLVVIHNCPPSWTPSPDAGAGRLRAAAGLAPGTPVVLYHGGLMPHRGIEQLLDALRRPEMSGVHAIMLGYGPLRDLLIEQAATGGPMHGFLHTLEPVSPGELPAWVSEADAGIVAIQPTTLNHRLSTPNKLFDCIAAGTPVIASDLPAMRAIVLDSPGGSLGAVCDPTDPASIAAAIRSTLDLSAGERAELRARILRAAHERWNWETEGGKLIALYDTLGTEAVA